MLTLSIAVSLGSAQLHLAENLCWTNERGGCLVLLNLRMNNPNHYISGLIGLCRRSIALLLFCGVAIGAAHAQTSPPANPFTLNTLRINNGEIISRSRTVRLTIGATSTQGPITSMKLGDTVQDAFRPFQPFRSSISYTSPEAVGGRSAVGRHLIAVVLRDRRGNESPIYTIPIDIIPDLPTRPALTRNATPKVFLRRGNFAVAHLTPAVNDTSDPLVQMSTTQGDIVVELYRSQAPLTVANFLNYVDTNRYDNSFFHRLIPDFVIQGGGFFVESTINEIGQRQNNINVIPKFGTVVNEPGISNTKGTIAMAKVDGDPDSATSEWFFNLEDNSGNLDFQNGGFTVFGKVLESSMPLLENPDFGLGTRPTVPLDVGDGIQFSDLPIATPLSGNSVNLGYLVRLTNVSRFQFSVVRQIPGVRASIINNYLVLEPQGRPTSRNTSIILRAVTPDGRILDFPVAVDVQTNHPMLAGGVGTRTVRLREDTPVNINIPVTNPDGTPLEWLLDVAPTKGTLELLPETRPGARVIRYTPNLNENGSDTFRVRVFDDDIDPQKRGQDSLTINLQITPVNDLPTISAPSSLSADSAQVVEFDVTVDDVETPAEQLLFTATSGSSSIIRSTIAVIASEGNTRRVRFQAGTVTRPTPASIRLTVTDANRGRRTVAVPITVNPGRLPQ